MKFNCSYSELIAIDDPRIIPNPKNPKYKVYKDGRVYSFYSKKFMSPRNRKDGYLDIQISGKSTLVHRLVASSFFGESCLAVNHKDGNKKNNNIENLEYVTASENVRHSIYVLKNKHSYSGDLNSNNRIKSSEYSKILSMYCLGISRDEIANLYGVNKETIRFAMLKHDKISYGIMANINKKKWTNYRWK